MDNNVTVKFKRGSQSALSQTSAEDGVFYLTTDTGRLYVGQKISNQETIMVELNKSITEVSKIIAASGGGYNVVTPTSGIRPVEPGEFYYLADGNILMIGQPEQRLLQVNQDNNTYIQSVNSQVGASNGVFSAVHTLTSNSGEAKTLTTEFVAGNGITLSQPTGTNKRIQIEANTTMSIDSVGADGSTATVKVNNASLTLKSNTTNGIKFSNDNNALKLELPDSIAVPEYEMKHGGQNGHEVITLKKDSSGTPISLGDVKVTYGETATSATSTYNSLTNTHDVTLNVYTKSEVDTKFGQIAGALDYRGAISRVPAAGDGSGAEGALVTGDMWKASTTITIPAASSSSGKNETAKTGDLIIVDANGKFDVIPSGDDQNINIETTSNTELTEFVVKDGTDPIGIIKFDSQNDDTTDTAIKFKSSQQGNNGLTVKADLKPLATAPTSSYNNVDAAATGTVNLAAGKDVLTGLTIDSYGRVTGYTKAKYSIPAAQKLTLTCGTVDSVSTLTIALSDDNTEHKITSNTLSIGGTKNNVTLDLVWGTF